MYLPDSLRVLSRTAQNAFNSFLFNMTGVHFVKQRAKKDAVSAFTDGFLFSSAPTTSSCIASSVVC